VILDFRLPILDWGEKQMHKKFRIRFGFSRSDNRQSKIENLKSAGVVGILVLILGCVGMAQAQQPSKIPRIGFLSTASLSSLSPRLDALRQGLKELGYVEGKNITIEYRSAEGHVNRLPELAAELARLKVDCFVTAGSSPTRAAIQATSAIPIIATTLGDPVAAGIVASLARPGGNITGLTSNSSELAGKRLECSKKLFLGFLASPFSGIGAVCPPILKRPGPPHGC
jgi:ABC-type uncharacterized transport system substrate-binding protein